MLSLLPEDLISHRIAEFLHAPDLLNLLCANKAISRLGTSSVVFWTRLLNWDDYDEVQHGGGVDDEVNEDQDDHSHDGRSSSWSPHSHHGGVTLDGDVKDTSKKEPKTSMIRLVHQQYAALSVDADKSAAIAAAKLRYLIRACTSSTSPSVRWHPLRRGDEAIGRPRLSRGCHAMCVLGDCHRGRRVILAGCGLLENHTTSVHVLNIPRASPEGGPEEPRERICGRWFRCASHDESSTAPAPAPVMEGATLTALDFCHAVHFGGFYYSERGTNDVHVLTVREMGGDGGKDKKKTQPVAIWRRVHAGGELPAPRAYHTATLINRRYLLILGGVTRNPGPREMFDPALLDCKTWTWLPCPITIGANHEERLQEPAGRYFHSVVLDERRHSLVVFGGKHLSGVESGGTVYGLDYGDGGSLWREDMVRSLPWRWTQVREDDKDEDVEDDDEDPEGLNDEREGKGKGGNEKWRKVRLSPAERRSLSHIHLSFKVAPDTVLLVFSREYLRANSVLMYDLRNDQFRRVTVKSSNTIPFLPLPVGVHLDMEGWIMAHNFTKIFDSTDRMALLDLAPALLQLRKGMFGPPL